MNPSVASRQASCRPTASGRPRSLHVPFQTHASRCRTNPAQAPASRHAPHQPFVSSAPQHAARCWAPVRAQSVDDVVRVATVGDIVTIHYTCKGPDGAVLDSSREDNGALSFEVGAGDVMGNKLFQGFDEAIRGMAVGQSTVLEATGGDWNKELLFPVPRDHPEVARLEGRYKNHGGLKEGMIVELANNSLAVVVSITDASVVIDANNMMAGKQLLFELELVAIEKADQSTASSPSFL